MLTQSTQDPLVIQIAGQHSLNYPPSFLFRYLLLEILYIYLSSSQVSAATRRRADRTTTARTRSVSQPPIAQRQPRATPTVINVPHHRRNPTTRRCVMEVPIPVSTVNVPDRSVWRRE